jgi:phytoene dehydrogenase-like protein
LIQERFSFQTQLEMTLFSQYFLSVNLEKSYFEKISTGHFFYTPRREGLSQAGKAPMNRSWKEIQEWLARFFALTTYEISIPALRDSSLAPQGKTGLIVSVLFDYGLTKYINEKGWYQKFKDLAENLTLETLEKSIYPGISGALIDKFSSTPLTLEQITGNTEGAITGWAFTNNPNPAENQLINISRAVNTPIPGIFQAGQWTFSPSGFPVSLITAKLAADKILNNLKKQKQ